MAQVALLVTNVRVVQNADWDPMTGDGTGHCGQIAALPYYAPFGIHR
jgi:hypothetical protein